MSAQEKSQELGWLFGLNNAEADYLPIGRRNQRIQELAGHPVNLLRLNAEQRQEIIDRIYKQTKSKRSRKKSA